MSSIKVTASQFKLLRKCKGIAADIVNSAIQRFESGELVIQNSDIVKEPLVILPIRQKPKYCDSKIRAILQAHFDKPINVKTDIDRLDKEIDAMFNVIMAQGIKIVESD